MGIQMRVLLLALGVTQVLGQLEADIAPQPQLAAAATTFSPQLITTRQPATISLTNLLRDQVQQTRQQQQTRQINTQQQTNVNQAPTLSSSSSSSSSSATTINLPSSSSQISQVITTTTTTTTTQVPNDLQDNNKFQYVKPVTLKCLHNNQSYSIGQRWNDDCLQICECVSNEDPLNPMAISACRNRCPTYKDQPGENCRLQRSKFDECCLDWVCDTEGKLIPSTTTTVMNTERGQLNVSTTEIKLPSSSGSQPTTSAWVMSSSSSSLASQPVTTTMASPAASAFLSSSALPSAPVSQAPLATTTQTPPPTTTRLATTQQARVIMTTTKLPIVPTTTAPTISPTIQERRKPSSSSPSLPPTTTIATPAAASSVSGSNRSPKAAPELGRVSNEAAVVGPSSRNVPRFVASTTEASAPLINSEDQPVDPHEMDLCIVDNSGYRVNQIWSEEPCNQTCRCVFQSEPRNPTADVRIVPTPNLKTGSEGTEIRCGLPPQCALEAMKLVPSADCPNPKLIMPQESLDKCACPRVVCMPRPPTTLSTGSSSRSPVQTITTTTTSSPSSSSQATEIGPVDGLVEESYVAGCQAKKGGRLLNFGETFNDECHSTCRCYDDSEIRCQPLACPPEPRADTSCIKWSLDPNFIANSTENKCCPQYICKEPVMKPRSCNMMGKEVAHGQRLPEEIQPRTADCERACTCNDGKIICQPVCPKLSEYPPEDLNCPLDQAYKTSDECCPKWSCPITEEYALQGFEVVPMNATSVEVTFLLPMFAVGRRGQAELNYTGVPANEVGSLGDMPPVNAHWTRKSNIKTSDGIFFSPTVKYHLNNLKPAHKYWFKLIVHFSDAQSPLDDPLESSLQRVVMPSLSRKEDSLEGESISVSSISSISSTSTSTSTSTTSTSTTTTTTTTTTPAPPPTRILQPRPSPTHLPSGTLRPNSQASSVTSTATRVTSPPTSHSTSTTTTTTTTTTTEQPPSMSPDRPLGSSKTETSDNNNTGDIVKPEIQDHYSPPPCSRANDNNRIDDRMPLPLTEQIHIQLIQRYAWHFLVGFFTMTILFTIVSFMYLKKSSRVIAPITSQSAYDNPSFTKLKSYNPQTLLIDETSHQNYSNEGILAKQKNLGADKASPLYNHQLNDLHHHNGRQHLI